MCIGGIRSKPPNAGGRGCDPRSQDLEEGATLVLTVLSVCIQLVVVFKFNLGIYIILRDMASCCLQAFSLAVCAAVCIRKLEEPSGRRRRSRTGATSRQLGTFFQ